MKLVILNSFIVLMEDDEALSEQARHSQAVVMPLAAAVAASDLMEACCAALSFVEAQDRGDEPGPVTELADKLRAAIRKAQGK